MGCVKKLKLCYAVSLRAVKYFLNLPSPSVENELYLLYSFGT
jgi:hypothetical protein